MVAKSSVVKLSESVSAPVTVTVGPVVWVHAYVSGPVPVAVALTVTGAPKPAVSWSVTATAIGSVTSVTSTVFGPDQVTAIGTVFSSYPAR